MQNTVFEFILATKIVNKDNTQFQARTMSRFYLENNKRSLQDLTLQKNVLTESNFVFSSVQHFSNDQLLRRGDVSLCTIKLIMSNQQVQHRNAYSVFFLMIFAQAIGLATFLYFSGKFLLWTYPKFAMEMQAIQISFQFKSNEIKTPKKGVNPASL